ncbi:MAG: hypothetical protein LC126_19860 [Bryobacterales bacterium]|nr:hypothetical protein [Bryobacterales bacterium]
MSREPYFVGVDLRDESTVTNLLDCIAGFPVFVDGLRENGADDHGVTAAIGDLMNLVQQADQHGEDLRLLGALAPDLLYIRVSELLDFDRWTRVYAGMAPQLLLDQLRVRGVSSFYILDNSIREDRFDALVKIFRCRLFGISPNGGLSEAEVLNQMALKFFGSILYVERTRGELPMLSGACTKRRGTPWPSATRLQRSTPWRFCSWRAAARGSNGALYVLGTSELASSEAICWKTPLIAGGGQVAKVRNASKTGSHYLRDSVDSIPAGEIRDPLAQIRWIL